MNDAPPQLLPIDGPVDIPNPWLPWIIAGALLGTILTALLLSSIARRLKQRRRRRDEAPVDPYTHARTEIQRLRPLVQRRQDEPFILQASEILRTYIEARFHLPVSERTTEEFLPEASRHPSLHGAPADTLARFLDQADLVKFARQRLTVQQVEALYMRALDFLDQSHQRTQQQPPAA